MRYILAVEHDRTGQTASTTSRSADKTESSALPMHHRRQMKMLV
jgi:hypothetical protein